jgi:hypothetical protein
MSFLFQKDVPLVLTIIIAAWTWVLSEQIKSFDKLQLIEYSYAPNGHGNKILFRNISQSQNIKSLKVIVTCAKGPDCFTVESGFAGTTEFVPPFGVRPQEIGSEGSSLASFTFSLAVDSALILSMYTKDLTPGTDKLRFTIVNAQDFDHLKLVNSESYFAYIYRYEWEGIYILLIVATLGIVWLMKASRPKDPPSTGSNQGEPTCCVQF